MAKLTEFKNPLSGEKASIFDIGNLWNMILGVFVLFFVFATGQALARKAQKTVPLIDTTIEKPWTEPPVATPSNTKIVL